MKDKEKGGEAKTMVTEPNVHWFHIEHPISGYAFRGSCLHQIRASGYEKAVEKLFAKVMNEEWSHLGGKKYAHWIEGEAKRQGFEDVREFFRDEMFRESSWKIFGDVSIRVVHDDDVNRY